MKNMIADPQLTFTGCNEKNGTALEGGFYNSISVETNGEGMIWWGQNMILTFKDCDIKGAMTSSVAAHNGYSYYLADADNEYGGIPVNGDGFEIAGKWEEPSSVLPRLPRARVRRIWPVCRPWTRCLPWRECRLCPSRSSTLPPIMMSRAI